MATVTRNLNDVEAIMRTAISRRNVNDPDSTYEVLVRYINDFISLTMSSDLKIFENYGTLIFEIDQTHLDGVYTFNDVGAAFQFTNISSEAMISLTDPPAGSVSWNPLQIYQDPGQFFSIWGVNNEDILIPGYPTMMLFYGNEMTFRTIPNTSYKVYLWGYKEVAELSPVGNPQLPYAYWLRYVAYGAAMNYGRDYNFSAEKMSGLQQSFLHEKKLLLTRTHEQRKISRCFPRF